MELWIVMGVAALVAIYVIASFNRLVTLRYRVRDAWAQIDVQLKRRHDLIPNLVNAVKGYMEHERNVLESVTRAREQAVAAGSNINARAAAESTLSVATSRFMAVAEAYPALRASENILALQEDLASTENRIAFARQFYNDSVMEYNAARATFPRNLLAAAFGFAAAEMFVLDDPEQKAAPRVRV
jgi:LemA protein